MPEQHAAQPNIVVFSSLFPSRMQPGAGLFIRERMFRVGQHVPVCVVSPAPWFPLQRLLRRWRPGFRIGAPAHERQQGVDVWFPRFFSVPGLLKGFDGFFMAVGAWPRLRRLQREGRLGVIDAHFAYPDGYAAALLGRWLGVPVTITMRGTEARHASDPKFAGRVRIALQRASRVFAVSESLRRVAIGLGISPDHVRVIANGVDIFKFSPLPQHEARVQLDLPVDAPVLVTVGALVERKGFHRVIELLPALRTRHPGLIYLVVGGSSPEGDISERLRKQVHDLGLDDAVCFLGPLPPEKLRVPLSAADVSVLATSNEGWANVLLESFACGRPVVTTDVGGNAEVVCDERLGIVVPFGDAQALQAALDGALAIRWDAVAIRRHAESNTWDQRVSALLDEFRAVRQAPSGPAASTQRAGHA